jgi:NADPH:quinone reductase-like Zn-dependent oxidoreductase
MKALVLNEADTFPILSEFDEPKVQSEDEVIVDVKAAALNRRDYWICKGLYPNINYPIILGSDVCGMCNGEEVIVDPGIDWGNDESVQASNFQILGLPRHGSLAERVRVPASNVYKKPLHLSSEEAAALPLVGVTAYRALFSRAKIHTGDKVLISGVGGGVASVALSMAVAINAEVYVTSGSEKKISRAIELGAKGGINYKSPDFSNDLKDLCSGFDVIVDSAGGKGFNALVKALKPGGRLVFYGGTQGKIEELSPQLIFWRQLSLLGSTMGSPRDFQAMLSFVEEHKISPQIDSTFGLDESIKGFERLASNHQFGKIVFSIA